MAECSEQAHFQPLKPLSFKYFYIFETKQFMKIKIYSILLLLTYFQIHSQLIEDFEFGFGSNNWVWHSANGYNLELQKQWELTADPFGPILGLNSAIIDKENISLGNTAEYWLISKELSINDNEELTFWGNQTIAEDQGSLFEVWATTGDQTNYPGYVQIASWTESQFSSSPINDVKKTIPLTSFGGSSIYIAFIRRHTQTSAAIGGDRWIIDNIAIEDGPLKIRSYNKDIFKAYPNPTADFWNFEAGGKIIESIKIINVLGKVVLSITPNNSNAIIDASFLDSGIYFADISTAVESAKMVLIRK